MPSHAAPNFVRESFLPPRSVPVSQNGSSRVAFIDLAKGVCIMLVVLFHLDSEIFGIANFSALRMPLYFTLSGLFFKSYQNIAVFTVKKVNNILVPFLFWVLLGYLLQFLYHWFELHEIYPPVKLVDGFTSRIVRPNFPIWFLFCLFVTNILFYILNTFLNGVGLLIGVLLLAVVGCAADACDVYMALWIDSACTAMPFFYLGYLLKKTLLMNESSSRWISLLVGGLCIGIAYLIFYLFEPYCDFCTNLVDGNALALYLDGIFFVLGVLLVCKAVRWLPIFSYWGRYSIVILCVQAIFFVHLRTLVFKISGYHLSSDEYKISVLLLCWLSIPFCQKFLPWFVARKPLLKIPLLQPVGACRTS